MVYFSICHRHNAYCGGLNDGDCKVTMHSCNGVDDHCLLKRKCRNKKHEIAVSQPILTIAQVEANSLKENNAIILEYLSSKSSSGPVEVVPDNISSILQSSKNSTYQQIRRAKEQGLRK